MAAGLRASERACMVARRSSVYPKRSDESQEANVKREKVQGWGSGWADRQTDSFIWDTNPHTPRLYFKPAPPLHLPRHNDLLGLHRLIAGMERYNAS